MLDQNTIEKIENNSNLLFTYPDALEICGVLMGAPEIVKAYIRQSIASFDMLDEVDLSDLEDDKYSDLWNAVYELAIRKSASLIFEEVVESLNEDLEMKGHTARFYFELNPDGTMKSLACSDPEALKDLMDTYDLDEYFSRPNFQA